MGPEIGLKDMQNEIRRDSAGDRIPIIFSTSCHYTNWASLAIRARILCICMHFKLQEEWGGSWELVQQSELAA